MQRLQLFRRVQVRRLTNLKQAMDSNGVLRDEVLNRFVHDSTGAYLSYHIFPNPMNTEKNVLDLQSTFVPPSGRGKGLAKILCESAFRYADEEGLQISPTCSYISETYMKKEQISPTLSFVKVDGTNF
jgi:uncharacterized protein